MSTPQTDIRKDDLSYAEFVQSVLNDYRLAVEARKPA
jgi:hypothetical protein